MKGDFTRYTFQPHKHYSGVRMQQGRLQLDADWNEQVDIQTYLFRTQIRDLVGDSGAVAQGFQIGLTKTNGQPDGKDLTIAPGHIYVDGTLCELEQLTTYQQQPDSPNPLLPTASGTYLVYLDVWQRHITAIEDPTLREVALGVPDTATRSQTVWQVKLLQVTGNDPDSTWQNFQQANANRQVHLSATVKLNGDSGAGNQRENHLYRVEVHTDDNGDGTLNNLDQPTANRKLNFKWSRDNGSIASAIKDIKGNTIVISNVGREDAQFFAPGQWIEVTDDRRELAHQPGIFVRLTAATAGNELKFDPNTLNGDQPINLTNFPLTDQPKVRRWEHNTTTDKAVIPLDNDWIPLEAGIEVKFDDFKARPYRSGDYWLLPVRANQSRQAIPWLDQSQAAQGIQHRYSLLGEVVFNDQDRSFSNLRDRRITFPSLVNCLSATTTLSTQILGIGLAAGETAQASLDVQASSAPPGTGTLSGNNNSRTALAVGDFASGLAVGDLITIAVTPPITRTVTQIDRLAGTLQVDPPFSTSFADRPFTIQKPLLRLADTTGKAQLVVNGQGKLMASDVDVSGTFHTNTFVTDQFQVSGDTTIGGRLTVQQGLKLQGDAVIQAFSLDGGFSQSNDATAPTTQAVRTFVTTQLNGLNQDLTRQINTVNQTLTSQMGGVSTRLETVNQTLTNQIGVVSTHLETVNQTLTNQIGTINQTLNGKANSQGSASQDFQTKNLKVQGTLQVQQGVAIQTFSNDGNFTLASDAAIPTEKAIKTYVDRQVDAANQTVNQTVIQSTGGKADRNGSADEDFQANNLKLFGDLQLQGPIAIQDFSNDGKLSPNNDITLPTTKAVKTYVDDRIAAITPTPPQTLLPNERPIAPSQRLQTQDLQVQGTLQLRDSTPVVAFSNDGDLTLNSDDAIPTEKAVKTYVDAQVAALARSLASRTSAPIPTFMPPAAASAAPTAVSDRAATLSLGTNGDATTFPATLTVQGTAPSFPAGSTISGSPDSPVLTLQGSSPALHMGDLITTDSQTRIVTQIDPLTVNQPFARELTNVVFTIQSPIVRLHSHDHTTQLVIAAQDQQGDVVIGTNNANAKLKVNADVDVMGTVKANNLANVSSRALKQNIVELSSQESRSLLRVLHPVKFQFRSETNGKTHAGFIAEEVPDLLASDDKTAINPLEIVAVLTKTVQDQQQAIASLTNILKAHQTQIALLTEKVAQLETQTH